MGPQIRFASRQRVGVITEARDLHGIVYLVVPPVDEFCGELQETAFTTALEAYAAKYPNKSVDDVVEGRHRGYNADERSLAGDVWHHRILVIQAIRSWLAHDPAAQTGWLGALRDRQIGRAIALIHREPIRQIRTG